MLGLFWLLIRAFDEHSAISAFGEDFAEFEFAINLLEGQIAVDRRFGAVFEADADRLLEFAVGRGKMGVGDDGRGLVLALRRRLFQAIGSTSIISSAGGGSSPKCSWA